MSRLECNTTDDMVFDIKHATEMLLSSAAVASNSIISTPSLQEVNFQRKRRKRKEMGVLHGGKEKRKAEAEGGR